jgi:hypothetical protein
MPSGYLNGGRWSLIEEFVEVESGKRNDRPQLTAALAACKWDWSYVGYFGLELEAMLRGKSAWRSPILNDYFGLISRSCGS